MHLLIYAVAFRRYWNTKSIMKLQKLHTYATNPQKNATR